MSATEMIFIAIFVWMTIGVVAGIVMGRRGHSWFTWAALGTVLGPLVIPLALTDVREEPDIRAITLDRGRPGTGPLHVVVGIDGSPESRAALTSTLALLGDRLGTLTLAAVLDYDTAASSRQWEESEQAKAALADAAAVAKKDLHLSPETVLLAGPPARALLDHATTAGVDLLAIGSRGRGATKMLLGSVASHLAAATETPVLIVSVDRSGRPPVPT
ncbi:MAG: universal stress protein [Acidimicrobiia bacterium]|nr:universal stress protein [Acidimicrobiia bacterium]